MHKIALITGATGGIGRQIALTFSQNGYAVALQYHTRHSEAQRIAKQFPTDTNWIALPCDLTDVEKTERMLDRLFTEFGRPTVLVNCAGMAPKQALFTDSTDAQFREVFELNVLAPMRLTRMVLDDLRHNAGTVINVSSIWGVAGGSCEVIYSASKAALIGFTKALAKEMAPSGVTVNCIAPGFVPTDMNAHLSADEVEQIRQDTPLLRLGTPADIADAALFLAKARFVTGQVLCVDGGTVM